MNLDAERMVNANIALDVCGVILTLIPIFYLLSGKRYKQRLNQYFLGICVSNIFMIFGDLTDWMFQSANTLWEKRIVLLGSALFYAASALVLYFFRLLYRRVYAPWEAKPEHLPVFCIGGMRGTAFLCAEQPVYRCLLLRHQARLPARRMVHNFAAYSAVLLFPVCCAGCFPAKEADMA